MQCLGPSSAASRCCKRSALSELLVAASASSLGKGFGIEIGQGHEI